VPHTKFRTVQRLVDVSDGQCASSVFLAPSVEHSYLIDFTYRGRRHLPEPAFARADQSEAGAENPPARLRKRVHSFAQLGPRP
jgi:hypothetical protein